MPCGLPFYPTQRESNQFISMCPPCPKSILSKVFWKPSWQSVLQGVTPIVCANRTVPTMGHSSFATPNCPWNYGCMEVDPNIIEPSWELVRPDIGSTFPRLRSMETPESKTGSTELGATLNGIIDGSYSMQGNHQEVPGDQPTIRAMWNLQCSRKVWFRESRAEQSAELQTTADCWDCKRRAGGKARRNRSEQTTAENWMHKERGGSGIPFASSNRRKTPYCLRLTVPLPAMHSIRRCTHSSIINPLSDPRPSSFLFHCPHALMRGPTVNWARMHLYGSAMLKTNGNKTADVAPNDHHHRCA